MNSYAAPSCLSPRSPARVTLAGAPAARAAAAAHRLRGQGWIQRVRPPCCVASMHCCRLGRVAALSLIGCSGRGLRRARAGPQTRPPAALLQPPTAPAHVQPRSRTGQPYIHMRVSAIGSAARTQRHGRAAAPAPRGAARLSASSRAPSCRPCRCSRDRRPRQTPDPRAWPPSAG